jgi:hypothetical protein
MLKLLLIFAIFIALFTAHGVYRAYGKFSAWMEWLRNGKI